MPSSHIPTSIRQKKLRAYSPRTILRPVASINGSNSNLRGFEALLTSVLGPKANEKGSFRLLKADVSSQTYVKIGFSVEKKLKEGEAGFGLENYPDRRAKPECVRMHFDGEKIVPERVEPVIIEDTCPKHANK